ncbi:protein ALP1-like [Lolium perenne]|uniref:protein ALP1-like n=1 Tax=Lolium perenne TaxID=4522 RepID=UPI003A99D764
MYFKEVLYAIGKLRGEMIKPSSSTIPTKIAESHRWFPYFKDCVGAIDGTHITTKVRRSHSLSYIGRKHYNSQNVLAAVDFNMKFTYVLAGCEGSTHDATILVDSLERVDGLKVYEGKLYLADAGYACHPSFLPPLRTTRYHINEFSTRLYPKNAKELFNLRHSSLRVTAERAFAALKNKFNILEHKPFHTFST